MKLSAKLMTEETTNFIKPYITDELFVDFCNREEELYSKCMANSLEIYEDLEKAMNHRKGLVEEYNKNVVEYVLRRIIKLGEKF